MSPTARQLYLLRWVSKNLVTVRWRDSWGIIRPDEYSRNADTRDPSNREGQKLLDAGWIELVEWPGNWTENTETGERWQHHKAKLTPAGEAILASHG